MSAVSKTRLDVLLAERGLFESRAQASAAVLAGDVSIGVGGRKLTKPGQQVASDIDLNVRARDRYVSRGGIKLANALDELVARYGMAPEIESKHCMDVGASTGGFTDVLLQRGATHVVALDVGYGELHWKLRSDDRVTVMERQNVRELAPAQLPYQPDLIVADLSFIALAKVLPAIAACAAVRFDLVGMVKPQFEVGRERVGKGGVVRELEVRRDALRSVAAAGASIALSVQGFASSGLPGPAGNQETFVWFAEGGRGHGCDVEAEILAVNA